MTPRSFGTASNDLLAQLETATRRLERVSLDPSHLSPEEETLAPTPQFPAEGTDRSRS